MTIGNFILTMVSHLGSLIMLKQPKGIAITAMFTALVTVVTMFMAIPIPASGGYFNLGEGIIYIAAMLFGPYVAAIAGGVGSMLADVFAGYPVWAPGTLVIKAAEGFLVGFLFLKLKHHVQQPEDLEFPPRTFMRILVAGFAMAGIVTGLGMTLMPGEVVLWVILAVGIMVSSIIAVSWSRVHLVRMLVPMIAGGAVMVFGYLLFGMYAVSYPMVNYGALSEIMFNVVQVIAGMVVAMLVYQPVYKSKVLDAFGIAGS